MKRSIRVLAVLMLVVMFIATLTACNGNGIVGKWEMEEQPGFIYEFKADGTLIGTYRGETQETRYKLEGDTLLVLEDDEYEVAGTVSINGDTLTIDSPWDEVVVLKRV